MKKLTLLILAVFLAGCGGTVTQSWTNFRAYYNTYYNAQKSFRAGLKEAVNQPVTIDPQSPVRVHPEPQGAGSPHFATAIEKGARVLRRFPDSKWVEGAVFLIGQSYYYQREFYPAIQKFEELYALTPGAELRQQAIIWKGRSMLDLGKYQEAILYLEDELTELEGEWLPARKAEVEVLLGEHYAMIANWESSATYLGMAIRNLNDKAYLGRTYFLYGQALEQLKRYSEAFFAYDQVSLQYPDYEFIYWAEIKKGALARMEGNTELALAIFNSMKKDDKNYGRRHELNFQVALTQEMNGEFNTAEKMYKRLLHSGAAVPPRDLQAKVYYRLGNIYSEHYKNFEPAAAYFDSASMLAVNTAGANVGGETEAGILAAAYGRYVTLKDEISYADSLLWLSSLSPAELDSAIEKVRAQKRRELQARFRNDEPTSGQFIVNDVEPAVIDQQRQLASRYGFLNYRNQNLVADSKNKFRAVWGNRPLVDNWRRREVVVITAAGQPARGKRAKGPVPTTEPQKGISDNQLDINLAEIPASEEEKIELMQRKAEALYELGNLFFLTLELPDSAAPYFQQVVDARPEGELEAKSMYSLFELHRLNGRDRSTRKWGERILQIYPQTEYARRVYGGLGIAVDSVTANAETGNTLLNAFRAVLQASDTLSRPERAEQLRKLALENRHNRLASHIHFQAIQSYIQAAKDHTDPDAYQRFWSNHQTYTSADSSQTTLLPNAQSNDSSLVIDEPVFYGFYWDSVGVLLKEYSSVFEGGPHQSRLQELKQLLGEHNSKAEALQSCTALGLKPEIRPGMEALLTHINMPDSLVAGNLPENISYRIIIRSNGSPISFRPETPISKALSGAYQQAFGEHLQFAPFENTQYPSLVECTVTFPVKKP